MPDEKIFTGTVVFWNEERGYGFLEPLFGDLADIFVHHSQVPGRRGHKNLVKGTQVEFEIQVRDAKIYATNVRIVEEKDTQPPWMHEQNMANSRR
jgi:cold shock CspA family protein